MIPSKSEEVPAIGPFQALHAARRITAGPSSVITLNGLVNGLGHGAGITDRGSG